MSPHTCARAVTRPCQLSLGSRMPGLSFHISVLPLSYLGCVSHRIHSDKPYLVTEIFGSFTLSLIIWVQVHHVTFVLVFPTCSPFLHWFFFIPGLSSISWPVITYHSFRSHLGITCVSDSLKSSVCCPVTSWPTTPGPGSHPCPPHIVLLCFVLVFFVLAAPHGMWDLSSPTRDRTRAPCIGSVES